MKAPLTAITAIVSTLISSLAAISTTLFSNWNSTQLETLKIQASDTQAKRDHFYSRCSAMNLLYKDMTLTMQNLYNGNTPGNIESTLEKFAKLRSDSSIAESYFGAKAQQVSEKYQAHLDAKKSNNQKHSPEEDLIPAIIGLAEELKTCNGPTSFPESKTSDAV